MKSILSLLLITATFVVSAQTYFYLPGDTITLDLPVFRGSLQWQQSVDNVTWANIPGATYQPYKTVFTSDKYFRAIVTDGTCNPVYSQVSFAAAYFVQQRLNAGETPQQIYNSGIPLDSLYGRTYLGGLIFYLNTTTWAGMVSAINEQSTGAEWGCYGTTIAGADGIVIGTGAQNTIDIELGCTSAGTPADICANLTLNTYSDWFLPSKYELNEMYTNLKLNGFGGFIAFTYWSSSEIDYVSAWNQDFTDGVPYNCGKTGNCYVRCVRSF